MPDPAGGGVPYTDALRQVKPTSLQELFSKNPEELSREDIMATVLAMNDLRERLAATATVRNVRVKTAGEPSSPARATRIATDLSDLGF